MGFLGRPWGRRVLCRRYVIVTTCFQTRRANPIATELSFGEVFASPVCAIDSTGQLVASDSVYPLLQCHHAQRARQNDVASQLEDVVLSDAGSLDHCGWQVRRIWFPSTGDRNWYTAHHFDRHWSLLTDAAGYLVGQS